MYNRGTCCLILLDVFIISFLINVHIKNYRNLLPFFSGYIDVSDDCFFSDLLYFFEMHILFYSLFLSIAAIYFFINAPYTFFGIQNGIIM